MDRGPAAALPFPHSLAGMRTERVKRERGATREERGGQMRIAPTSDASGLLV
jgi:hypothetical protein